MSNITPYSIGAQHITAFEEVFKDRLAGIDISQVMANFIDNVSVNALPSIAKYWDILGNRGYGLAQTEAEKRAMIKRAHELHRYKGTPYAIKEGLKSIGFTQVTILEGVGGQSIKYDGTHAFNGSAQYGAMTLGYHWATFMVIALGHPNVTPQVDAQARDIINLFKNARSLLVGVGYTAVSGLNNELDLSL
jgi:hypothetical protein